MSEDARAYRVEPDRAFADRMEVALLERLAGVEMVAELQTDAPDERRRSARPRPTNRRRILVAAAVVAAVAILIASSQLLPGKDDDHVRTNPVGPTDASTAPPAPTAPSPPTVAAPPTSTGDGSTEAPLLPQGAPSTPHVGEVIVSATTGVQSQTFRSYLLFADGRFIWCCETATDHGGAYVEQRLTPEGAERVRSTYLASGVFDPAVPADAGAGLCMTLQPGYCVRGDDGRLLYALTSARDADLLLSYVRTLEMSLPETDWVDREVKPFVASRINACLQMYVDAVQVAPDVAALVPLFPPRVAELLGSRAPTVTPAPAACFEMTRDEAQIVVDELLAPSANGVHEYWGILIGVTDTYDGTLRYSSDTNTAYFRFDPLLPNGELAMVGG
jgi:hypothetical protein